MVSNVDALSDVLRMVHLRACIYFVKDMPAPWGMDIPAVANGPLHMVLEGSCVLVIGGEKIDLNAGDAVLLPHGARHQMLDASETVPEPGPEVMQRLLDREYQPPENSATRMLCGHFEWDSTFEHPLFRELPALMVVRDIFSGDQGERFKAIVGLITAESEDLRPGNSAVSDRMGEVLFVGMLRQWLVETKPERGLLATINSPRLSRALHQIHNSPDAALDLNVLARTAGMSRTSFAVQFRDRMGVPPAEYLARWRMLKARNMLLQTDLATSDISSRVGYGSDAAFSRAFKREYGVPPSQLRKQY
jgi:AraC-like DNA-binding protein